MEGLPTWAKVGIGVIGAAIAVATGMGLANVALKMVGSALGGATFGALTYGVQSLATGHFDKTEMLNYMLDGAADMFMISGVVLGAKGVVDCVARNSGRIRKAMLANEEGSTNAVDKLDDFYESRFCVNSENDGASLLETSKPISGKTNDHHIIPKFRGKSKPYADFIAKRGIDVDQYTITVSAGKGGIHMNSIHGKGNWNPIWKEWIDNNPNATAKDIFQFAGKMMDDYGLNRYEIHPYLEGGR